MSVNAALCVRVCDRERFVVSISGVACVSRHASAQVRERLPSSFCFSALQLCACGDRSPAETKGEQLHGCLSGRLVG